MRLPFDHGDATALANRFGEALRLSHAMGLYDERAAGRAVGVLLFEGFDARDVAHAVAAHLCPRGPTHPPDPSDTGAGFGDLERTAAEAFRLGEAYAYLHEREEALPVDPSALKRALGADPGVVGRMVLAAGDTADAFPDVGTNAVDLVLHERAMARAARALVQASAGLALESDL